MSEVEEMSAAKVRTDASSWVERVLQRELEAVCGDSARDVLGLALMFSDQAAVPAHSAALRQFIFGELKQTLARVEGLEVAAEQCDRLAMLLLDRTGTHRVTEHPKWSMTRLKAADSSADTRHTARPRTSHTKSVVQGLEATNLEDLLASVNLDVPQPVHEAVRTPVLVLSEAPEAAGTIQAELGECAEVYHHETLDFFESDLLILSEKRPIVVLDCRGKHAAFAERFIRRADSNLALLVWGRSGVEQLPGKRMVACLANSTPAELAMLVGVFLPKFRKDSEA